MLLVCNFYLLWHNNRLYTHFLEGNDFGPQIWSSLLAPQEGPVFTCPTIMQEIPNCPNAKHVVLSCWLNMAVFYGLKYSDDLLEECKAPCWRPSFALSVNCAIQPHAFFQTVFCSDICGCFWRSLETDEYVLLLLLLLFGKNLQGSSQRCSYLYSTWLCPSESVLETPEFQLPDCPPCPPSTDLDRRQLQWPAKGIVNK